MEFTNKKKDSQVKGDEEERIIFRFGVYIAKSLDPSLAVSDDADDDT